MNDGVEVSFGDSDTQGFEAYKAFVISKASKNTLEGIENNMPDPMIAQIVTASLGLSGEVGELNDHIKKWLFQGHALDREYIKLELGDIFWYAALLMDQQNLTLREVLDANRDKLNKRYAKQATKEESVNREEGSVEATHQPELQENGLLPGEVTARCICGHLHHVHSRLDNKCMIDKMGVSEPHCDCMGFQRSDSWLKAAKEVAERQPYNANCPKVAATGYRCVLFNGHSGNCIEARQRS